MHDVNVRTEIRQCGLKCLALHGSHFGASSHEPDFEASQNTRQRHPNLSPNRQAGLLGNEEGLPVMDN